jgi:hypothetical protein
MTGVSAGVQLSAAVLVLAPPPPSPELHAARTNAASVATKR